MEVKGEPLQVGSLAQRILSMKKVVIQVDIPCGRITAKDLQWDDDHVAHIPWERIQDFIDGEGDGDGRNPTKFWKGTSRSGKGSLGLVDGKGPLYTLYYCAYGPNDLRHLQQEVVHRSAIPKSGKGSRPRGQIIKRGDSCKRGCQCRFSVLEIITPSHVAKITYKNRAHVDKANKPCHGKDDQDSLDTPRMFAPRISDDLKSYVMGKLCLGMKPNQIQAEHSKSLKMRSLMDPNFEENLTRDDFMQMYDIRNIKKKFKKEKLQYATNDNQSLHLFATYFHEKVFMYEPYIDDNHPLILGFQSEWQFHALVKYGHASALSMDSTFGTKRSKFPLYTLLVFDDHHSGIPAAWILTSNAKEMYLGRWLKVLYEKCRRIQPSWEPRAIIVDDAIVEHNAIRATFPTANVILCLWLVRHDWVKHLKKKVHCPAIRAKMLRRLGEIMYVNHRGTYIHQVILDGAKKDLQKFYEDFPKENDFNKYIQTYWEPNIAKWIKAAWDYPHANQETNAAIENYHGSMKAIINDDNKILSRTRGDYLLWKLACDVEAWYFHLQSLKRKELVINATLEKYVNNAVSTGKTISARDVEIMCTQGEVSMARVRSQTLENKWYQVYNYDTEWGYCECPWSMKGNICKHMIAALMKESSNEVDLVKILGTSFGVQNEIAHLKFRRQQFNEQDGNDSSKVVTNIRNEDRESIPLEVDLQLGPQEIVADSMEEMENLFANIRQACMNDPRLLTFAAKALMEISKNVETARDAIENGMIPYLGNSFSAHEDGLFNSINRVKSNFERGSRWRRRSI